MFLVILRPNIIYECCGLDCELGEESSQFLEAIYADARWAD